jgi:hypothetical protein
LLAILAASSVAGAQESIDPTFIEPYGVPLPIEVAPLAAPVPAQGDPARTSVQGILAQPEFRAVPEPGEGSVGEWVREMIERLIEMLMPDPDAMPTGPTFTLPGKEIFLVVGVLILLSGLGFVAWVMLGQRRKRPSGESEKSAPTEVDPRERDPADILAEAEGLRRSGDLRGALRVLYLATLVQLDRLRRISFDPSLTNWQYLRFFPPGDARDRFSELTRIFDHKWYGHEPISDDDYASAHARARVLVDQVGATAEVTP